ncbi:DUF4347 domain-containing protein [Methylobacterium longum]|uniref:DUF4347 domain-containing protein n=1 Tax=Methylobacterium longum TaxID=767694 RepID=A0ABT8AX04_9HYPH|nr:DUF4347 domain-containing protein [Methylobacterium longum]MDN3573961.1 DUF4347 domain-containing protein [Methylobacterium longum]GJE14763.1 hypothetical protein FOHLNKBM_5838 [Methylobacterium longum]
MGKKIHLVDSSISSDSSRFDKLSSRGSGDITIKIAASCNGNAQAVADIQKSLGSDKIDVLIIYGHGAPGVQGVAMGKDSAGVKENSAITLKAVTDEKSSWMSLRPYFSKEGAVVLKGCNTGRGQKGDELMLALAKAFGVPVTASDWYQLVGRTDVVGNIRTAYPSGKISEDKASGLVNLSAVPVIEAIAILGAQMFGNP